jgi:heavy metal translocating P-type ATPase
MSAGSNFAALETVHECRARVRFRYRPFRGLEAACILRAAAAMPGVRAARLNPKARALILHFDPAVTDAAALRAALIGLAPLAVATGRTSEAGKQSRPSPRGPIISLVTLLLSGQLPQVAKLPAALHAALPLYGEAARDFGEKGISSHVLEAMAVGISLASGDYLAANTTTFMLALGAYLEESIARRSDELLKHLLRPTGNEIWVERDGVEISIAADEVRVGDTVIVGAGLIIPVDGTVLSGDALVNEAAMTGETAAVHKARGKRVLSGTVVEEGRLLIYAEQVGLETAVARIADYVERSLTAKSSAQLNASTLADKLVPTVLKLAGLSWLVSGNWRRAAAVLQADYSCALKLATPVAFKSAMYDAGQRNILVKGADALERLSEADTFIFDKTGTLTTGELEVTDSITFDDAFTPQALIWLAASVEEHYFHPLALAVVAAAQTTAGRHFAHTEVEFIVAHGVISIIDGKRIVVGSRHFVEQHEGIDISPHRSAINRLYGEGKTLLYIGYGGSLLGVLGLKDHIRPESRAVISRLRALGAKRLLMLTGDHEHRAAELAAELGLDGYHAELMPEEKAAIVQHLTAQGARIAFVGDGINDAPALAAAHVGIAMQKGADVARLTADIALLEDSIESVAAAKDIANTVMERIAADYRLTVTLNTGILTAAALGLLSPVLTTLLHNGSTLGILMNAFRTIKTSNGKNPPRARSPVPPPTPEAVPSSSDRAMT